MAHPARPLQMAAPRGRVATAVARRSRDLGVTLTAFHVIVIGVAGGSAIALLGWPGQSGSYFSWNLGAPSAAATIGGLYLASVATFGAALARSRSRTHSLSIGVLALALPTLLFTATHRAAFDWSRPQAAAWVILFLSAPVVITQDLRTPAGPDHSPPAGLGTRTTLVIVALVGTVGAGALWIEPFRSNVAAQSPIPIVGLTGRYMGAWCAFLAATMASAAVRGRTADARLATVLLATASIGLLTAAARTAGDLGPNAAAYVIAVSAVGIVAIVLHRRSRTTSAPPPNNKESSKIMTSALAADDSVRS